MRISDEIWESSIEMIHTTSILVLSNFDSILGYIFMNIFVHQYQGHRPRTKFSSFCVACSDLNFFPAQAVAALVTFHKNDAVQVGI